MASSVAVQVTVDVVELDERRQALLSCGLDLAAILTQLRRDHGQPDCVEHVLFPATADAFLAPEDAVLVELEAARHGHPAHGDVVGLRAREVVESRAVARGRHDPQVHLQAVVQTDRRARRAL
jgi:hypothetical protein